VNTDSFRFLHLCVETVRVVGKAFNLDPAVGPEKVVQAIHVHRECEKLVVTLLGMRGFSHSLGA